jgi:hypothetical protein
VKVYGPQGYVYMANLVAYGVLGRVVAGTVVGFVGNTGDAAEHLTARPLRVASQDPHLLRPGNPGHEGCGRPLPVPVRGVSSRPALIPGRSLLLHSATVQRPSRPLSSDLAVAAVVAGIAAVALASGIQHSPLSPVLPSGAGPIAPFRVAARAAGLDTISPGAQAAVSIAAVVACTFAFLFALREAWRGHLTLRLVVWLGAAFIVVATLMPLLFSRDVYSYSMYGRIASVHHANPYVAVPEQFPSDPVFHLVGPQWRHTEAVYGPAFTALSVLVTRVVGGTVGLIWVFKAVSGAAAVGMLLLVARTAGRLWPGRAAFAAALVGWNPVVLFHGVAGGHNDLLVGLAVAGAMAVLAGGRVQHNHYAQPDGYPQLGGGAQPGSYAQPDSDVQPGGGAQPGGGRSGLRGRKNPIWRRELLAGAVLTLGTMVKATAAVPLVLLVMASVWRRPREERARALATHAGLVAAIVAVFAGPFFQARDPTLGLATLATHQGWLAPTRFFRATLGALAHAIGGHGVESVVETVVRVAFVAAFLIVFAVLVRETARRARSSPPGGGGGEMARGATSLSALEQVAGWGWALVLFTLLAPVLLPWYAVWLLPMAWTLPRVPRTSVIVLSGFLAVSQTVAEAVQFPALFGAILLFGHYVLTPAVFAVLVWLLVDLRRRIRERLPLGAVAPPSPVREAVPAGTDRR